MAYLLPQSEDLEALEVAELSPLPAARAPLRPCATVPLVLYAVRLPLLLYRAGPGSVHDARNDNVREGDVLEGGGVAGDSLGRVGGGAVDEDLFECGKAVSAGFSSSRTWLLDESLNR